MTGYMPALDVNVAAIPGILLFGVVVLAIVFLAFALEAYLVNRGAK